MAKTKTPFLSLGARGSVGESITAQKRGRATLVRTKPLPTYRRTLPQMYQRWLYEDYAYLWRQQSQSVRDTYRAAGVLFHLTGFQYWMKVQLTSLPDIAAMYHLDKGETVTAIDFSRNANHGTIIGACPADGVIDGALYFDGLNNRVLIPSAPSLALPDDFTIEFFLYLYSLTTNPHIVNKSIASQNGYYVQISNAGAIRLHTNQPGAWQRANSADGEITINTQYHIAVVKKGTVGFTYKNGDDITHASAVMLTPTFTTEPLYFNTYRAGLSWGHCLTDHAILYNRALEPTEIKRHSERRYPPQ